MFKLEWDKKYTMIAIYAFLTITAAMTFYWSLENIVSVRTFLSSMITPIRPVIYGFILAYLLNPIMRFFEEKIVSRYFGQKLKKGQIRGISMFIAYVLAILVLTGFLLIDRKSVV